MKNQYRLSFKKQNTSNLALKIFIMGLSLMVTILFVNVELTAQGPTNQAVAQQQQLKLPCKSYKNETNYSSYYSCQFTGSRYNAEDTARSFLSNYADALGMASSSDDLRLIEVKHGLASSHSRFQQILNGYPVFGAYLSVHQGPDGSVHTLHTNYYSNLQVYTPVGQPLSLQALEKAAQEAAKITSLRQTSDVRYVWYPQKNNTAVLGLQLMIYASEPLGDFLTVVDAYTGQILFQENRISTDTGSGYAYIPNPYQTQGDATGMVDNNDATNPNLDAQRITATLQGLNSGTGLLMGEYVDLATLNSSSLPDIDANEPTRQYFYDRDDERFEQVVIYHSIDSIQRYFQALGFSDSNTPPNGIRDYPSLANAHWYDQDQSFYSTGNDAVHFGDGGVDDGEDADIVAHEYGHAVQHNQNSSWGGGEMGAMGEGFGDYLAASFYINDGDPAYQAVNAPCVGEWDATSYSSTDPPCLRRVDGTKIYPDDLEGQVHADGEIWSRAVWDIRLAIGPAADALILEHHFALPGSSSMPTAALAYIQADVDLNGGANDAAIRQAFCNRGILADLDCVSPIPDFNLTVIPDAVNVCYPNEALYTVFVEALNNFSDTVTLSVSNPPPASVATFSINPIIPTLPAATSTLIISGATVGSYSFDVIGVAVTRTHTSTVVLDVFDGSPGDVTLMLPSNGAIGVSLAPLFEWSTASNAGSYWLEVASDAAFNTIVYSTTTLNTSHQLPIALNPLTTYYWRVKAINNCGEGIFSSTFNFTTLDTPPVLVVDDDDNSPDVLSDYTNTLDALGIAYDVWDTGYSDTNEPTLTDLAPYQAVIWLTGASFSSATGPGSSTETDLGTFLDNGACLLMSSQDYLWAKGGGGADNPTPFMTNYLGLETGVSDVEHSITSGTGSVFSGLGPYTLNYPFANYSDDLTPDASAELAFSGNAGIGEAAIAKDNGTYKTTWLGFPFEALPNATAREEVMGAFFDWCDLGGASSITLEKTVGTDPSACATTDSVMVAPGIDVTYCYQVTNTGALTLTQHSLLDDQLGTIFSSTYSLAPQETMFITQTATITQDTMNVATWTAYNPGPVDVATATDMATVTIANPAISLAKTVSTDGTCGNSNQITVIGDTDISYCYNVTNIGNVALYTHTLVDDQLGIILDAQNPLLDIGESYEVITTTLITNTTVNSATWMATDDTASYQVQATDMATVTVIPASYGLQLDPDSSILTGSPADTVTHTLTLTNTGNTPDSFDLLASDYSWVTTVVTSVGPLQAGESTAIDVSVDIDILATHGDMDTALLTATSQADSQVTDSSIITTTATIISYTLSVNTVGNGSVSLNPTGNLYQENTVVTLTAIADTGWYFAGWSGDLSGTVATETLTMDNDKVVTATFTEIPPPTYTLTVSTVGSGTVTLNPDGGIYDENTEVELVATPDTGWYFAGWSGDLSSTVATETLTMDSDKVATATFAQSGTISYGVVVVSNNTALTATVGTTVSYTVWITNTGNAEETFTLVLSGETWSSTLSSNSTGVLSANQGTTATISVAVPSTATNGDSDSVLLTASSINASDSLTLTTTAINDGSTGEIGFKVYLPLVFK